MDDYGKSSIGNQLCIDLVTATSPSTSSSASSSNTSSPTSPISQESPSLCNVRFHREHSESSIIINNNTNHSNNNNNNTPTSQNANLTNNAQEIIKQAIPNANNKKVYAASITHPQRHYNSKKVKKPTIDTKRKTVTPPSTTLLSSYHPSPASAPARYNNVYRFYNGGGINNNKSADFASYDDPDRIIPTDELALFMRNKRRYCPPNFKPIPPSPGGWSEVVPDRTIAWELTCENHTDVSPFLRLRTLDGPLEIPWQQTTLSITMNPAGSWNSPHQVRHRQQQHLRRDDARPLHYRSMEHVTTSASSLGASNAHLVPSSSSSSSPPPPSSPATHSSHYSIPPSTSLLTTSSLVSSEQCQVYVSSCQSNTHGDLGSSNAKDEPSLQTPKKKKNMLSPLDTAFTQLLNPFPTMTYPSFQSTASHDSIQELPAQAVQVNTAKQKSRWNAQQQQQQQQEQQQHQRREDNHRYSSSYSTPSSAIRQHQQFRTSFELLSPPPATIDSIDYPTRNNKMGPGGSPCSLFSLWGTTSPPPPSSSSSSTWLHDISPMEDSILQQQQQYHHQRSSSFTREYDSNTAYYRTRSSSLGIIRPSHQRRSLPQKDDTVSSTPVVWKFQPLLSPTSAAAPSTESSSSSSSVSSSSSLAWPLLQQQQQHYHQQQQHQRPPTPDEIQDQRGKRSSTSDIQAWQHHYHQQQQQLQHKLQQWTLTSNGHHGDSKSCVPQQQHQQHQQHQQQQQQQRDMDDRSISILRVLDTENDHSTGQYSLFSKPVVATGSKKEQPPTSSTATQGSTAKNNHSHHHHHHRLYYSFSDYVVVSDA